MQTKNATNILLLFCILIAIEACKKEYDDNEPIPLAEPERESSTAMQIKAEGEMIFWNGGLIQNFIVNQVIDERDTVLYDGVVYGISPNPLLDAANGLPGNNTKVLLTACYDGAGTRYYCRHGGDDYEVKASFLKPNQINYIRPFIMTTSGIIYGEDLEINNNESPTCKLTIDRFFDGRSKYNYYYNMNGDMMYGERVTRLDNSDGFTYNTKAFDFHYSDDKISTTGWVNVELNFKEGKIESFKGDESEDIHDHSFVWLDDSTLSHKIFTGAYITQDTFLPSYDSAIYSFNKEGNIYKVEPYLLLRQSEYLKKPEMIFEFDNHINPVKGIPTKLFFQPKPTNYLEYFNYNLIQTWRQADNIYEMKWTVANEDLQTVFSTNDYLYEYRAILSNCN